MKKTLVSIAVLILCLSAGSPVFAEQDVHFNFGLMPGGIIIAPDADGFKASSSTTFTYRTTELSGSVLFAPGGFIGLDYDTSMSGVGIDAFANYLWSTAITGTIYGGNLSYIFPHRENGIFRVRAKVGILAGTLDWDSDNNVVEFEDASGWQGGLGFEVGRMVRFYGEILYRDLEFDVDKGKSDHVNRDTLDLSGAVVNLGVKFSF